MVHTVGTVYLNMERKRGIVECKSSLFLRTYLELAVTGEDADPLVVVVRDYNVSARVNSDPCWTLQLPRRAPPHPETALKLALV